MDVPETNGSSGEGEYKARYPKELQHRTRGRDSFQVSLGGKRDVDK